MDTKEHTTWTERRAFWSAFILAYRIQERKS